MGADSNCVFIVEQIICPESIVSGQGGWVGVQNVILSNTSGKCYFAFQVLSDFLQGGDVHCSQVRPSTLISFSLLVD